MTIEFRLAITDDIAAILKLHYRYQVDSIDQDDKKDGFITTAFEHKQLSALIEQESGLFVALKDDKIVAYAMAASWSFWSQWPMFAHMIEELASVQYAGQILSTENSYQYGPVCVDKSVRGQGVFEGIFSYALQAMAQKYPILITFINKVNPRSYAAHTKKVGLEVVQEFEYNNNHYHQLACLTNKA